MEFKYFGKNSALALKKVFALINHAHGDATTSAAGFMSKSDKQKLNGITSGAEVNQNAFSYVKVGTTTISADNKTDTLEYVAGSNVQLTPDATNDKLTISATDTKYSAMKGATASAGGSSGLVPTPAAGTQDKYLRGDGTWQIPPNTTYGAAGTGLGLVKSGGDVTISNGTITVNDDSHNHVIGNVDGLQSALDGKASSGHTHNYAGSSSAGGSANSAVKFATARNINGVAFDGTKNIDIIANPKSTQLVSNNLNDVRTVGFYHGAGGNTVTNKPSGVAAFGLIVMQTAGGYITQILIEGDTHQGKIWQRQFNGSAWSGWTFVYSQLFKPSKSDVGLSAVENKSSATIRGEITKDNVTKALGYTPPTTNTTYGVGNASTAGIVKLYGSLGQGTDGSMTQAAISSAISAASGNKVIISTSEPSCNINDEWLLPY